RQRQCLLERVGGQHSLSPPVGVAGHHDRDPRSQRSTDRVVRRAAHHERSAQGGGLEVGEVLGDPPRDAAAVADDAVVGVRRDQGHAVSRRPQSGLLNQRGGRLNQRGGLLDQRSGLLNQRGGLLNQRGGLL